MGERQVAVEKMQLLYEGEGLDKSIIDSYKGIRVLAHSRAIIS